MSQLAPAKLALVKLHESGLDLKDMQRMRLKPLTGQQVQRLNATFKARPGLQIPYFTWQGRPTNFYRLRYLGPPPSAFGEQPAKAPKYVQPPDTGTAAYFPPGFDWKEALKPRTPLFITEGELKSGKACKEDIATIGLGGVFNFQSLRAGVPFLPELVAIDWKDRAVNVVFDSDYATNPNVRVALHRLTHELVTRGARVRVVQLPTLEGLEKTGLDDFLVREGREAFGDLVTQAVDAAEAKALWAWNDRFAYIKEPGNLVVDQVTGQRFRNDVFEHQAYRNHKITVQVPRADGTTKFEEQCLASIWLDWPHRFELDRLVYEPGQARITGQAFNLWPGWGSEAEKGDISLWQKLIDHTFRGDPVAQQWFERWCAYPVQRPGTKLYSAVVLWSYQHGAGKSIIGETLCRVYGDANSSEISQEDLENSFNDWADCKQFVFGDEITGQDNHQFADRLKQLITRERVRINQKHVPKFSVRDVINYLFTTNKPHAFYLEPKDRRYMFWHVPEDPLPLAFFEQYRVWLRSPACGPALRWHLEHVPLGDFKPWAPALMTKAKEEAIEGSRSDVSQWLEDLRRGAIKTLLPDLATTRELLAEHERLTGRSRLSISGMSRALGAAGFEQWGKPKDGSAGSYIYVHGAGDRYWIVKRADKWIAAKQNEARRYLEQQHPKLLDDDDEKKY